MTDDQKAQFERLETISERAKFLLDIGVTARIEIEDLTPIFQACVGDILLPITASSKGHVIKKATDWLQQKCHRN